MEEISAEKIMKELQDELEARRKAAESVRFEDLPIPPAHSAQQRRRSDFAHIPVGAALVNVGAEDDPFEQETFEKDVAAADAAWRVSFFHPIPGGKIKGFFKRVVRKLIRSCIEPITQEISAFHGTLVYCLDALRRFVREQLRRETKRDAELDELRSQVAELSARLEALEKDRA